jgi:hypothetical protein
VAGLGHGQRRRLSMVVGETLELFIVFGTIIFSLFLLVLIDRIGIVKSPADEEEEEL